MRLLKIIGSLLAGALIVVTMLGLKAQAQSRYDADQQWVRKTLREERRRERHALDVEYHQPRAHRHYYAPPPRRREPRYDPHDWRYRESRRQDHHHGTRVYGVAIRRLDATGSVDCYPPVEAYSTEANSDDAAWLDAQRNFENQVRAMYGEKWLDVRNARDIEKQCWASSGNQSVAGRVAERVGSAVQSITGNEGGLDGRKHRCRILARPCQAPKEMNPDTKGDRR